jgi:hypothetical protein
MFHFYIRKQGSPDDSSLSFILEIAYHLTNNQLYVFFNNWMVYF